VERALDLIAVDKALGKFARTVGANILGDVIAVANLENRNSLTCEAGF
jgi:hypothetical protein